MLSFVYNRSNSISYYGILLFVLSVVIVPYYPVKGAQVNSSVQIGSLLKELSGHSAKVNTVTFSPNGTLIASGSADNSVRLWNVISGEETRVLRGPDTTVLKVSFSPNGSLISAGFDDGSIVIWNVDNGRKISELAGHTRAINALAFTYDGTRIISGSKDNSVVVWKISPVKILFNLTSHTCDVILLAVSRNDLFASASQDKTILIWDLEDGTLVETIKDHESPIMSIAYTSDNQLVSCDAEVILKIRDGIGRHPESIALNLRTIISAQFSNDAYLLIVWSADRTLSVWDVQDRRFLWSAACSGDILTIAFSPDKTIFVTGNLDSTLHLFNLGMNTGQYRRTFGFNSVFSDLTFSNDGQYLAISRFSMLKVFDVPSGINRWSESYSAYNIIDVVFSPIGSILAIVADEKIILSNTTTGTIIQTLESDQNSILSIDFDPTGQLIAAIAYNSVIKLYNISTGEILLEFPDSLANCVKYSVDGNELITGGLDGNVRIWNASTANLLEIIPGSSSRLRDLTISPKGNYLVGKTKSEVIVWNLRNRSKMWLRNYQKQEVRTIAISSNESRVITINKNGVISSLDISTGELFSNQSFRPEHFYGSAYEPSSQCVALGHSDGWLDIWDLTLTSGTFTDADFDGIPDIWEIQHRLDPMTYWDKYGDNDFDGLVNILEYQLGSDPRDFDTDNDGIPDYSEYILGFSLTTDSSYGDADRDGMPNLWEYENGLNPIYNDALEDPDGDGLNNLEEFHRGCDPRNPDTDSDGVLDGQDNSPLDPMPETFYFFGIIFVIGLCILIAFLFVIELIAILKR